MYLLWYLPFHQICFCCCLFQGKTSQNCQPHDRPKEVNVHIKTMGRKTFSIFCGIADPISDMLFKWSFYLCCRLWGNI